METLVRDLRYTLTSMRRSPGLTATVMVTLALGIGITTAVFTVVHGMLLRPLPYPDPDRLVRVWEEHPGGTALLGNRWLSNLTQTAWTRRPQTIENIGAFATYDKTVTFGHEDPIKMIGADVSPSVFELLRETPALGRFFRTEEEREADSHVVVLSDQLWRERFNAAPDVLGQTINVDDTPHEIVGVARPGFEFPDRRIKFWVPNVVPAWAAEPERTRVFSAIARLRPGVHPAQAETEGTAAARTIPRPASADMWFGKGGPVVVHVRPLVEDMTSAVKPALLVLVAAVALVLLIACANVANLLLSRGLEREREMVIRVAVGAGRSRLVRQLLTESTVLAMAGGALGLVLAWFLTRVFLTLAPPGLPRMENVRIDAAVTAFGLIASMAAAVIAGLLPALRTSRAELFHSIRLTEGSAAAGGAPARRLRRVLLVLEAAFAVILVVGAGLLTRSFVRLMNVDAGYSPEHVLMARIELPAGMKPEQTAQFLDAVLPRVRSLSGVEAAGAGNMMPLMLRTAMSTFTIPEWVAAGKPPMPRAMTYIVTPGYGDALSLRIKEGRLFKDDDVHNGARPVLVNEEFVRRHVGRRPVVGLKLGPLYKSDTRIETEIVGVIGNVLKNGNDKAAEPEIYFMQGTGNQRIDGIVNLVVRTTGDPAALAQTLRGVVRATDRRAVVERIDPLDRLLSESVAQPRFGVTVFGVFAALAMALAAVGLYGVLSYAVSQRRRELGLRAALGADRGSLVSLVLREALTIAAVGGIAGALAAGALTRVMQSMLFGISPADPASYAIALGVLVVIALIAGLAPAWRAATIDPAIALRE
jgi:predicted permease